MHALLRVHVCANWNVYCIKYKEISQETKEKWFARGWYLQELASVLSLCQGYLEPIHPECLGHICYAGAQSAA